MAPVPSVQDAFAELLHRIELNPHRVALASQRYNAVKSALEASLAGSSVRQIGSFQRRTKIRPQSLSDYLDVDALVVMGTFRGRASGATGIHATDALATAHKALRRDLTYKVMDSTVDAPIIELVYADDFRIELAVGYVDLTGDYPRTAGPPCYVVADSSGAWRPADYDFDAEKISAINNELAVGGSLVPAIKLVKRWLRNHQVPLRSFHIEILASAVLSAAMRRWAAAGSRFDYCHLLAEFLAEAHAFLTGPIRLSDSYSMPTDSALSPSSLREIGEYLKSEGKTAWAHCRIVDFPKAMASWSTFYGEPFPPLSALT